MKQIRLSVLNKLYGDTHGTGYVLKILPGVGDQEVPSNQILSNIKPGDIVSLPDPGPNEYVHFKVLPDLPVAESIPNNSNMHIDDFIEQLQELVPQTDKKTYAKCVQLFRSGVPGEQIITKLVRRPISESNQEYKKFIYHISENDFKKANDALEKVLEQKVRERISKSLKRVNEGFFDRLGAKASGLGAGIKANVQNAVTRGTSAVKAVGQNIAGAATGNGFTAGQQTVDSATSQIDANDPRKRAKAAKANSLIGSIEKDLSTLYPDINVKKVLSNLRTQLNFSKA